MASPSGISGSRSALESEPPSRRRLPGDAIRKGSSGGRSVSVSRHKASVKPEHRCGRWRPSRARQRAAIAVRRPFTLRLQPGRPSTVAPRRVESESPPGCRNPLCARIILHRKRSVGGKKGQGRRGFMTPLVQKQRNTRFPHRKERLCAPRSLTARLPREALKSAELDKRLNPQLRLASRQRKLAGVAHAGKDLRTVL